MDSELKNKWAELQKTITEELSRRKKTAQSPAEAIRGYDDFCRERVARFNFENPEFTSEWIDIRTSILSDDLASARTLGDYQGLLVKLSSRSPFALATSECPQYALIPPILKPSDEWMSLIESYWDKKTACRLLGRGFIPIPSQVVGHEIVGSHQCDYILVDADYGIAVLPPGAPRKTIGLDLAMIERYSEIAPEILHHPSDIFDVGIRRGMRLFHGRVHDNPALISIDIHSRAELDQIIKRLYNNAKQENRFEIWYRGQPREYVLPDLRREAQQGICPWRHVQDISLVPSLYRDGAKNASDIHSYCRQQIEVHKYYLFMKESLGLPTHSTRPKDEPLIELFTKRWGKDHPEFTVTLSLDDGETVEHHDTHVAFRNLQAALFLQHYGLKSNVIDLTNDIDVALFFAQNEVVGNKYVNVDHSTTTPVLYIFILDKELDPFMNTYEILEDYDVLRPKRQHCGILAGASMISRNYQARFVSLKLNIKIRIQMEYEGKDYLFPTPEEDKFLDNLIVFTKLQNMEYVSPFVPL